MCDDGGSSGGVEVAIGNTAAISKICYIQWELFHDNMSLWVKNYDYKYKYNTVIGILLETNLIKNK